MARARLSTDPPSCGGPSWRDLSCREAWRSGEAGDDGGEGVDHGRVEPGAGAVGDLLGEARVQDPVDAAMAAGNDLHAHPSPLLPVAWSGTDWRRI
jgi:hypothetical protein